MARLYSTIAPQGPGDRIADAARRIADQAISQARQEVQGQLVGARAERAALQGQLNTVQSGPARAELMNQLEIVDAKIEKLEEAMDKLGDARTNVTPRPSPRFSTTSTPAPSLPGMRVDPTEIVATSLGILFIAFPLTLALVRFIWKRSTSAPPAAISAEQARRFDRLEQSVDAIAIEIERISENQRYLTRVLGEAKSSAKVEAGSRG